MMDASNIKDRLNEVKSRDLKSFWPVAGVLTVFIIALYLRYIPAQGMQYLQALDPYWIFRQSQHLAFEGNIPATDFMRYFPYNAPFHKFNNGDIIIPAILYWLGPFMIFKSFMSWAQFYPALLGALSVVATYFLGKETFNKETGLASAFFLATVGGVLHRTSAGFFEKEPLGTFFMITSLYFFTRGWKRKEHISGILSGVTLGLFTISWGGSKMLWLLYPMVVGLMMWINRDIEELVTTYTPTVIVAGGLAAVINPSRFSITSSIFLANLALLAFLWARYAVEELELIDEEYVRYFVPSVSALGLLMILLSPFYYQPIYLKFVNLLGSVSGGGAVIAGTVAENTASSIGRMASQLGAAAAGSGTSSLISQIPLVGDVIATSILGNIVSILAGIVGRYSGAWVFAVIGIPLLATKIGLMIFKSYGLIEEKITQKSYLAYNQATLIGWFSLVGGFALMNALQSAGAIEGLLRVETILASAVLLTIGWIVAYKFDEDDAFSLNSIYTVIFVVGMIAATIYLGSVQRTGILQSLLSTSFATAILHPLALASVGIGSIKLFEELSEYSIEIKLYQVLPLIWVVTNTLGAASKSRLVFLSAFSTAFIAGYLFTAIFKRLRSFDRDNLNAIGLGASVLLINLLALTIGRALGLNPIILLGIVLAANAPIAYLVAEKEELLESVQDSSRLSKGVLVSIVALTVITNFAAGFATAQNFGGSPSPQWMDNLEAMENETPEGSVVLSWWDYGYWFESVGRRAAVADGGNNGYYSQEQYGKTNYPIADFLTSSSPENHTELLEKHSVDYIVLDETMIGKYSAVSQIANRDNSEFSSMLQVSTSRNIRESLSTNNQNETVLTASRGRLKAYAPLESSGPGSIELSTQQDRKPQLELPTRRGTVRREFGCVITEEEGLTEFENVSQPAQLSSFGEVCLAENPFYSVERAFFTSQNENRRSQQAKLVIVPKEIATSSLVRLYLMDGKGIDFVEKVDSASNGFVKMWKVDGIDDDTS